MMSKNVTCTLCYKQYKCKYFDECEKMYPCICTVCTKDNVGGLTTFPLSFSIICYIVRTILYCKRNPVQIKNVLRRMLVLRGLTT